MNCSEIRPLLDAYLDRELDLMTSLRVEEHLHTCMDCPQVLERRTAVQDRCANAVRTICRPERIGEADRGCHSAARGDSNTTEDYNPGSASLAVLAQFCSGDLHTFTGMYSLAGGNEASQYHPRHTSYGGTGL